MDKKNIFNMSSEELDDKLKMDSESYIITTSGTTGDFVYNDRVYIGDYPYVVDDQIVPVVPSVITTTTYPIMDEERMSEWEERLKKLEKREKIWAIQKECMNDIIKVLQKEMKMLKKLNNISHKEKKVKKT